VAAEEGVVHVAWRHGLAGPGHRVGQLVAASMLAALLVALLALPLRAPSLPDAPYDSVLRIRELPARSYAVTSQLLREQLGGG
jgi:hypothetical protein